jgi:hypothetical protein
MDKVLAALTESFKELPSRKEFVSAFEALVRLVANALKDMDRKVDGRLRSLKNGRDGKDGARGPKGDRGEQGRSVQGPPGKDGADGKDGSPDTADDIRNKLELLEGDDRLKIEAIKDLREELDELRERAGRSNAPTAFAIQRGQLRAYDLSDQLDGSKKTFSMPAFWRIISVQSTSTPTIFRPTVDYTADASVPSITFTDQIDAASTLAAGQTLLIIYAEP